MALKVLEDGGGVNFSYFVHADDDSLLRLDLLGTLLVRGVALRPAALAEAETSLLTLNRPTSQRRTHTPDSTGVQPSPALLLGLHLGRHRQQGDAPHPQQTQQVAHA